MKTSGRIDPAEKEKKKQRKKAISARKAPITSSFWSSKMKDLISTTINKFHKYSLTPDQEGIWPN